jgi:hypothetical protein
MKLDTPRQILSDTNGVAKAVERVSKESNRGGSDKNRVDPAAKWFFLKLGPGFIRSERNSNE